MVGDVEGSGGGHCVFVVDEGDRERDGGLGGAVGLWGQNDDIAAEQVGVREDEAVVSEARAVGELRDDGLELGL